MKNLIVICLLSSAFCLPASAGLVLTFAAPVDCSAYTGSGEVRFRLLNAQGAALGDGAVFGIILADPAGDDAAVEAAILAAIPPA